MSLRELALRRLGLHRIAASKREHKPVFTRLAAANLALFVRTKPEARVRTRQATNQLIFLKQPPQQQVYARPLVAKRVYAKLQ